MKKNLYDRIDDYDLGARGKFSQNRVSPPEQIERMDNNGEILPVWRRKHRTRGSPMSFSRSSMEKTSWVMISWITSSWKRPT